MAKAKTKKAEKIVTLREICESVGIAPKAARRTLRRAARTGTIGFRREGPVGEPDKDWNKKWTFSTAQAKEIKAILAPAQ